MRRAAFLVIALGMAVFPVRAATTSISIKNLAFNPPSVTIVVGDSVTWTNNDMFNHTTTSDTLDWDSGPLAPGSTFTFVFNSAGTFKYHCNIHPSMHGEVIVRSSIGPPGPPQNLTAQPGTSIGDVALSWQAPSDDGGSPITGYRVCRDSTCFDVGNVTSYTDSGLMILQSYTYTVQGTNAYGSGPVSNSACSKPFPWLAPLDCII